MTTVQLALFGQRGYVITVQSSHACASSAQVQEALQDLLVTDGFKIVDQGPLIVELTLKPDTMPETVFRMMAAAIRATNSNLEVEIPQFKVRA